MAKRWYVVHVYSGFEKKIATAIKEQAEQKGLADHSTKFWCRPRKWWKSAAARR